MKKYSLIPGIASAVLMMMTACADKARTERQERIIPVKVMEIMALPVANERAYVGTVEESQAVSLSFAGMGTIEQVLVPEGQTVRKGQLLATLNTTTAQNSYDASQASLHQAQDAYDRLSKLHANGSLPDVKFVEVETGLQQAKAQAARAQKALDDCHLYAPLSGIIAERSAEAGANAMPGVAAFKLVSIDRILVKISVPENEIGSTARGQEARLEVPALDNAVFTGKIETKGVSANPLSHTYVVKIEVANAGATTVSPLLPGMVCKVRLNRNETTGIVIPNQAVQVSHDGKRFVWIAGDNRAMRRFVTVGSLVDNGVIIAGGLSAGDFLIVEGFQKISEGMKIKL
jgi:RND family efflux transporter MFP subunit